LGQIGSMKIKGKLLVKVKIRLVIITIVWIHGIKQEELPQIQKKW
jgi:hypothetical protein